MAAGGPLVLVLTRSAHDLGAGFGRGGIASVALAESEQTPRNASEDELAVFVRLSSLEGAPAFEESDAALVVGFFVAFGGRGMLGIGGLRGIAGKTGWAVVEGFGVVCCGGAADDGVVG